MVVHILLKIPKISGKERMRTSSVHDSLPVRHHRLRAHRRSSVVIARPCQIVNVYGRCHDIMFGVRGKEGRTKRARKDGREGRHRRRRGGGEEIHLEIIAMQNAGTSRAYIRHAREPRSRKKSQTGIGCSCGEKCFCFWVAFDVLFGCCVARRH